MLSAVSKAYVVLAVLGGAAAVIYILGTGGDRMGGTLLVTLAIAAVLFAIVAADRSVAGTDLERTPPADVAPAAMRPAGEPGPAASTPSSGPLLAAAGLASMAIGAAAGAFWVYLGGALLAAGAISWGAQAVREHPLYTRRFGDRLGRRGVGPFTYPLAAIALGALVAISASRLYLTISESAAVVVSGVVATALFVGALVLATAGDRNRRLVPVLSGVALVTLVGAGIAGTANGERKIPQHHGIQYSETEVEAEGIAYTTSEVALKEGKVLLTFHNRDPEGTYHNIGIYSAREAGQPFVAVLPIDGGEKRSTTVDTSEVGLQVGGSYFFRCDFHPAMVGTLRVEPAPEPSHDDEEGHS